MKLNDLKFRAYAGENGMLLSDQFDTLEAFFGFVAGMYFDDKGVHDYELMQWSGLRDKNGEEIYEGDKLKDHSGNIWIVLWHDDHACFGVRSENNNVQSEIIDNQNMEVIGDIYSNPELLQP